VHWLVTVVRIFHWFNPVLWIAFQRMAADRELACDESALSQMEEEKVSYGETIVRILEGCARLPKLPDLLGILESKDRAFERISMIANFRKRGRWSTLALLLLGVLAVIGLTDARSRSAVSLVAQDTNGPKLSVHFSHFRKEDGWVIAVLNVTNSGAGSVTVSKTVIDSGIWGGGLTIISCQALIPTNGAVTILKPGWATEVEYRLCSERAARKGFLAGVFSVRLALPYGAPGVRTGSVTFAEANCDDIRTGEVALLVPTEANHPFVDHSRKGAPELAASFSTYTNEGGRIVIAMNVTNTGSAAAVISSQLRDAGYGGSGGTTADCLTEGRTNASMRTVSPGAQAQVSLFVEKGAEFRNFNSKYKIRVLVPYGERLVDSDNGPQFQPRRVALCTNVPPYAKESVGVVPEPRRPEVRRDLEEVWKADANKLKEKVLSNQVDPNERLQALRDLTQGHWTEAYPWLLERCDGMPLNGNNYLLLGYEPAPGLQNAGRRIMVQKVMEIELLKSLGSFLSLRAQERMIQLLAREDLPVEIRLTALDQLHDYITIAGGVSSKFTWETRDDGREFAAEVPSQVDTNTPGVWHFKLPTDSERKSWRAKRLMRQLPNVIVKTEAIPKRLGVFVGTGTLPEFKGRDLKKEVDGLIEFADSASTISVTGARPELRLNFSHFTNREDQLFIILNVTNIGERAAAVRKGLNGDGVYSVNTASINWFAASPTNAGWTIIPPGTGTQVDFKTGRTNFWSSYKVLISVPYTDAMATNSAPGLYAVCEDIPYYDPAEAKLLVLGAARLQAVDSSIKISLGIREIKLPGVTNLAFPLAFRIENAGQATITREQIPAAFFKGILHVSPKDGNEQRTSFQKMWRTMSFDLQPGATFESPVVGNLLSFFPSLEDGFYKVWWTLGDSKSNDLSFSVAKGKVVKHDPNETDAIPHH
jgi:hypothetical protein